MAGAAWLADNWLAVLNTVGVVSTLLFTAFSLRSDTKTRRVTNLLEVTRNHRELWISFISNPALHRVIHPNPNLDTQPVTVEEEWFTRLIFLHAQTVYRSIEQSLLVRPEGIRRDLWWLASLPIPAQIWEKAKVLHDADFVSFVEQCRNWK